MASATTWPIRALTMRPTTPMAISPMTRPTTATIASRHGWPWSGRVTVITQPPAAKSGPRTHPAGRTYTRRRAHSAHRGRAHNRALPRPRAARGGPSRRERDDRRGRGPHRADRGHRPGHHRHRPAGDGRTGRVGGHPGEEADDA